MDTKLKAKKKGQRYTMKELHARGWTDSLISGHLTAQRWKGGVYFRASDVDRAIARTPGLETVLAENAARSKAVAHLRKRYLANRDTLVHETAGALDLAFREAEMDLETRAVAGAWHRLFMGTLRTRNCFKAPDRWSLPDIAKGLGQLRFQDTRELAHKWANLARMAWLPLAQGRQLAPVYIEALTVISAVELDRLASRGGAEPASEILSLTSVRDQYPMKFGLYECYVAFYIPASISKDLSRLIAVDPKDEYPAARQMKRCFKVHVGGTNTGKTHESLQRLKQASSGVYLAPLRLLALEVQERLLEDGVVCSMLTGEEEDLREGATHISSTVEKLDLRRRYEVAVIDECQMISDQERGFAWTRAILGVQAEEIHLCVAPEGLHILERLIKELGEPYTVITHERKVPLRWERRPVPMKQAQKGDAFVAFSKKRVLQLAEELRRNGVPTSIIYGNLPYATRRKQMQMFLDGETTALVATDAIGMGLNLPIRRVVFTEDRKYDGSSVRPLKAGEVRQIAGRAGRFGIYDEGYAAAAPGCPNGLGSLLDTMPPDVDTVSLGFSDLVLKVDRPLVDVLKVWNQMPVRPPYRRMDIARHIVIINYIQKSLGLDFSKEDLLRASNIPFDERDYDLLARFGLYCRAYADGAPSLPPPEREGVRLSDLEHYYKLLDLYYSVSNTFRLSWDREWLAQEKEQVAEEINHLLVHELKKKGASCRECGKAIPLDSPYALCDKCFLKKRDH